MKIRIAVALAFMAATALAAEPPRRYSEAEAIWREKKDDATYQSYAGEFAKFNNHFRLDEQNGCYALGSERVNLMLIITHPTNSEFAVVERVLSDIDSAKARCFRRSYESLRTKVPPFVPFVLQMSMG